VINETNNKIEEVMNKYEPLFIINDESKGKSTEKFEEMIMDSKELLEKMNMRIT
jgi:hypothetical protein